MELASKEYEQALSLYPPDEHYSPRNWMMGMLIQMLCQEGEIGKVDSLLKVSKADLDKIADLTKNGKKKRDTKSYSFFCANYFFSLYLYHFLASPTNDLAYACLDSIDSIAAHGQGDMTNLLMMSFVARMKLLLIDRDFDECQKVIEWGDTALPKRMEVRKLVARDIQMSMVPSVFPDYEGLDMYASMTPAKEVGGDLYGYVLICDKLYFALGDVSGKGVPASLFMAQATRLFRTLAAQQMMPAEICTCMNDALSGDDNGSGMFVTFFLGLLDLKTGLLKFCNAGHNPPIIGGGDNHGDFLEMIPNAPIGLFPELEYEGEEVADVKGRPLFIYTDGLNEAENREQEQFGDDRLVDILRATRFDSAKQLIDTLNVEVERHRDGTELNDDLTMMCIRLK